MSKLETVRGLNDSSPNLQIVAAVRTLQQIAQQMSDDLRSLPEAISKEVAPLVELEQIVGEIAQAQRTAISALVEQISGETKQGLKEVSDQIQISAQALKPLPALLQNLEEQERKSMKTQAKREQALDTMMQKVEDRMKRIQPRW
jgi:DNA repair exonuclease SbcCD ATPase subunit